MNNEVTNQDELPTLKDLDIQELALRFYRSVWEDSHEKVEERGNIIDEN